VELGLGLGNEPHVGRRETWLYDLEGARVHMSVYTCVRTPKDVSVSNLRFGAQK